MMLCHVKEEEEEGFISDKCAYHNYLNYDLKIYKIHKSEIFMINYVRL